MAGGFKWFGEGAKAYVLRKLDAMFREAGEAWVARAREIVPVDTGKLRDSIGFIYDAERRQLVLYADAIHASFIQWGTRFMKATPFMTMALSVVPRIFRGSSTIQTANTPPKYQAKTANFAKGKTRGAKLQVGHGKFR